MSDAAQISALLAARIERLVIDLLPAGKRIGAEWRVGSLAGEPGQSLAVHLGPSKAGVWSDFSSGQAGDALDLVAAVKFNRKIKEAIEWSCHWLGFSSTTTLPAPREKLNLPVSNVRTTRTAFAWRAFRAAQKDILGTPVEKYLYCRSINVRDLTRPLGSLRFHPTLWCVEAQKPLPAMVAAIAGVDNKFQALHRTWLQEAADGTWHKASLISAKKVLGSIAGGSIRLWRGSSEMPLSQASEPQSCIISEGIETGLSVAISCPERRVIAAITVGNMSAIVLPKIVSEVIIAADNDAPNSRATAALQKAIDRFISEGRTVKVARSPVGCDFNDALQGLLS